MTEEKFKEIINQNESQTLDFKKEIYKFSKNVSKGEKNKEVGNFLKDILALYNTKRSETAYIIIGIEEKGDHTKNFVGISNSDKIDDAILQDKIKDKVNVIPEFSLSYIDYNNKTFGIIAIPLPQYSIPSVALKTYGVLKENTVYIRKGSTNTEARPEDTKVINSWLDELESLGKRQNFSRKNFYEEVKGYVKVQSVLEKAQPVMKNKAKTIGISGEELDLIVETQKKKVEKQKKKLKAVRKFIDENLHFFIVGILLLGIIGSMILVAVYIQSDIDKIYKLLEQEKFEEAKSKLSSYDMTNKNKILKDILEKEIRYVVNANKIKKGVLLLSSYKVESIEFDYINKSQDKESFIYNYNEDVDWVNRMSMLLFNLALMKKDIMLCKQIANLLVLPTIKTIKKNKFVYDNSIQDKMNKFISNTIQ